MNTNMSEQNKWKGHLPVRGNAFDNRITKFLDPDKS